MEVSDYYLWSLVLQFVSIVITATVASMIAVFVFEYEKKFKISSINSELSKIAFIINSAFTKTTKDGVGVCSPYHNLIKKGEYSELFALHAESFFHHINMLRIFYENKELLGEEVEKQFTNWTTKIFKPWIKSNKDLSNLWEKLKKTNDLLDPEFVDWLKSLVDKD